MENQVNMQNSSINRRLHNTTIKQGKQNLLKKRPSTTKLDLQKIFQQSIELTQVFKKLSNQNTHLKQQYHKVQQAKSSRQSLISMVENVVKEKAKQLNKNPTNQSSWLVHKLNTKVYQLKSKIQAKQKSIREVEMSKESQWIRQKECELKCLDQVLNHLRVGDKSDPIKNVDKNNEHYEDFNENTQRNNGRSSILSGIKEIVWLQDQIRQKQDEVLETERQYEDEQRQVRKLMMEISKKKAELKQIKQLQQEFNKAQQQFKEEKKKKQQRLAGNKTYLDELIQSRHNQLKKLQQLKEKYNVIEVEENKNILELEAKLQKMKKQYEQKNRARQQLVFRVVEQPVSSNKQKWVKRVTFNQVKNIAKNLNYFIALKRISKDFILKTIFKEQDQQLSIRQVIKILEQYPFQISNYQQRQLLARYCIEDAGQGYFKEDMDTSQAVPIIKSVMSKLLGQVRVYSKEQEKHLMKKTGELMHKFHSLVQQNVQCKQGATKKTTKQIMQDAIVATQIDLDHDEINFIILYLFSWSNNINQLEFCHLGEMLEKGIKWLQRSNKSAEQSQLSHQQQSSEYVEEFQ